VPRYVDHGERRQELIEAATELVARRGRSALTVRNLADALGTSTKVVSHYFDDMAELLHATYTAAAERARARLDDVTAADPLDVRGLIEALLPLDQERHRDWLVWFAFWSEALTSEALASDQRERARTTALRLAATMRAMQTAGRLPESCDIDRAADRLGALIPGIAGQVVFDPKGWTAARQRAALATELDLLGLAGVAAS